MRFIDEAIRRISSLGEQPTPRGLVRFHLNENFFLPRQYYEELFSTIDAELARLYTEPLNEGLRARIGEYIGVDGRQVLVTNGADEGIRLLMQLSLFGSRRVAVFEPTFVMARLHAESLALDIAQLLLTESFDVDVDAAVKTGADVVYVAAPNNPTGNVPRYVDELAARFPGLVIIDEAYVEFVGGRGFLDLVEYGNVALVRTFSKAWGLAGLRVGYVVSSRRVIEALERLSMPHNVSAYSVAAVSAALRLRHYVDEAVRAVREAREYMVSRLLAMGLKPLPSVTNFVTFPIPNAERVVSELRSRGFAVRYVGWMPRLTSHIRVTVAPRQILDELMKTLSELIPR